MLNNRYKTIDFESGDNNFESLHQIKKSQQVGLLEEQSEKLKLLQSIKKQNDQYSFFQFKP